jgi:hypothetical protein
MDKQSLKKIYTSNLCIFFLLKYELTHYNFILIVREYEHKLLNKYNPITPRRIKRLGTHFFSKTKKKS